MKRLLAAATVLAASATLAPSASAQPCVVVPGPVADACVHDMGWEGRGVSVIVYGTEYAYVLAGCYYPTGSPRYYVGVGTGTTGPVSLYPAVGGVPCV